LAELPLVALHQWEIEKNPVDNTLNEKICSLPFYLEHYGWRLSLNRKSKPFDFNVKTKIKEDLLII
jgi:hypothetical protein